jgi:hypothetical protein
VDMELSGTIEPNHGASANQLEWIVLIGAHSSLAPGVPKPGVNPFSKQPILYKAAPDYARVLLDGRKVGAIHWAMDGSDRLVVWSLAAARTHVTEVAQDVASRLGWRFVIGAEGINL